MQKILVIKLSSLGDIAHAVPAIHAIQQRSGAQVDWVVQPEYAPLAAALPGINRIIPFPRRNFMRRLPAFLKDLRRERYDVIVDLQGLMKSAVVARLARGAWRVGPIWAREGAGLLYNANAGTLSSPRRHAVAELMEIADSIVPPEEQELPPVELEFTPFQMEEHPAPLIALAPFSRWETKNWPVEKFTAFGRRLVAETGGRIAIIGGGEDAAAGTAMAAQIGNSAVNYCGQTSLPELCALMKNLDLLISVDSGPLHWADLMGVPIVAVYGATDPVRTGPFYQPEGVVVKENLDCRPCHSRTCRRGDTACLNDLDVETVLAAALKRLRTPPASPPDSSIDAPDGNH